MEKGRKEREGTGMGRGGKDGEREEREEEMERRKEGEGRIRGEDFLPTVKSWIRHCISATAMTSMCSPLVAPYSTQ